MRLYYISIVDAYTGKFIGVVFTEARTDNDAISNIEILLPNGITASLLIIQSDKTVGDFDESMMELAAKVPYNVLLSKEDMDRLNLDPVKFSDM